jgi:hypothetical protein
MRQLETETTELKLEYRVRIARERDDVVKLGESGGNIIDLPRFNRLQLVPIRFRCCFCLAGPVSLVAALRSCVYASLLDPELLLSGSVPRLELSMVPGSRLVRAALDQ